VGVGAGDGDTVGVGVGGSVRADVDADPTVTVTVLERAVDDPPLYQTFATNWFDPLGKVSDVLTDVLP
jgi:choline dehydrogenase-like flavoprotein